MSKPRLCEILGVEVDQEFSSKGSNGTTSPNKYYVNSYGELINAKTGDSAACFTLCYFIRNPEDIVRKHSWTKKDIDDAKAVKLLWPDAVFVTRLKNIYITFASSNQRHTIVDCPYELFPSLAENETVNIDKVLMEYEYKENCDEQGNNGDTRDAEYL